MPSCQWKDCGLGCGWGRGLECGLGCGWCHRLETQCARPPELLVVKPSFLGDGGEDSASAKLE